MKTLMYVSQMYETLKTYSLRQYWCTLRRPGLECRHPNSSFKKIANISVYLQQYSVSEEESGYVRFRRNITEGTAVFTAGFK